MSDPLPDYRMDEPEVREHKPADSERLGIVRDNLRELGADLAAATTAADRLDWTAVLQAVRLIQGRAVVTRGLLERTPVQDASAEPPLLRVIGAIRPLIPDRGIDTLPPDELRARVRGVFQVLDRELKAVLSPSDKSSTP